MAFITEHPVSYKKNILPFPYFSREGMRQAHGKGGLARWGSAAKRLNADDRQYSVVAVVHVVFVRNSGAAAASLPSVMRLHGNLESQMGFNNRYATRIKFRCSAKGSNVFPVSFFLFLKLVFLIRKCDLFNFFVLIESVRTNTMWFI